MITMHRQISGYGPPAPVPIFQWEEEFTQLLDLYRERKPQRVLEIGTYHGGTLYHWLQNAPDGAVVVSVDSYKVRVDNRDQYEDWCPDNVWVIAVEGDSHSPETVDRVAKHGPYDWVWIDAGHRYHEVEQDWILYSALAKPGAVVCFHDVLPASRNHPEIEVSRLWAELKAEGYETDEIIGGHIDWGGIGVLHL